MIAETCSKTIKKNLDEVFTIVFKGLQDAHPRVRYQALTALGLILNETSPFLQEKYHTTIMPQLFKMMSEEELIKLKAQVVSTCCSFLNGLTNLEEDEEAELTPK